ncbi:MAG: aminotransferase class V-fold PLP-dependent enzyme [Actinomycetota bacterium]|nr:cysteine desulfurase [Actinomycetota bacterium]
MFDAKIVRKDFPILERTAPGGNQLVWLDNASTTQKPRAVIDSLVQYYEQHNSNVHRGVYFLAEEATELYEGARTRIAQFIGADPTGLVFTKSTTEAINLVAYAWGLYTLQEGDEILVTEMEHHSDLIPWQLIAKKTGATLVKLPVTDDGFLAMDQLPSLLTDKTKLVCVTQMSNVLGTINPIREIADAAHAVGALVLVDGAQGVPHLVTNVAEMDADFLALSGHKMLGPTGSGGLWARPELLDAMEPFHGGGEMIREVWFDRATYNVVPYKFEAGTPNIGPSIALGAAADYLTNLGMENVRTHEIEIARYAIAEMQKIEGLTIHGPTDAEYRGGVVSFWVDEVHPHDLATILDTEGIAIRAGHHCAQPLMRRLGVPATARASFYVYNTTEEVDALVKAIDIAKQRFAGAWA